MVTSVTHQVTAKLVSRRLQGLNNLIPIALIKSHLAQLLFVVFDSKGNDKRRCFDGINFSDTWMQDWGAS